MAPNHTAVIDGEQAVTDAYIMGYDRGPDGDELPDEVELDPHQSLEGFRDGARYANVTLPTLRAMAGFGDRGHGTYQEFREVVVVPAARVDDDPAVGARMSSDDVLRVLMDAWDCGYVDASEDRDPDHARAERIVGTIDAEHY